MDYFDKTYHPPGTPPGTLATSETDGQLHQIRLLNLHDSRITETELRHPDECQAHLASDVATWIHVQGNPTTETIRSLGHIFDLHPLAMEDILNQGQRPKIEEYDGLLFLILALPVQKENEFSVEQISIFLGRNFIISFHAGASDPFELIRNRLRKHNGHARLQKIDYLLYSILDLVIDQGYPILEGLGEEIEAIEEALLTATVERTTLADIHRLRRELLILRRNLWPQREIINNLMHGDHLFISEATHLYLRDCYDHVIQMLDLLETYREMAASLIDVYLSSSSHRLNEIMRVLTIIATIFIPLTFIVGVYGMNFSHPDSPWAMPELHWYYGYPLVWLLMIGIVVGMAVYFKRKKWF